MITNNEMQLKALLKDLSAKYGITPQATLQMYCLERLLDRIAVSRFHNHFVIKGGFLIASILGIGIRSTMDIDATVKGFSVCYENVDSIFKEICDIDIAAPTMFVVVIASPNTSTKYCQIHQKVIEKTCI